MMVKNYQNNAEKMCNYFKQHLDEGGSHWQYGYDVSIEWLRLVRGGANLEEVQNLLDRVYNPSEDQGSAFEELKFLICKWSENYTG